MPERLEQIQHWLQSQGMTDYQIAPASADASFRRYFRSVERDGRQRIVMDAPPDKEDCAPFIHVATLLESMGLHVPHIYAQDLQQGFLLLSDLGTEPYLPHLNIHSVDNLYGDAMEALLVMQRSTDKRIPALPAYDRDLLLREMELFREWLLKTHLGLQLSPQQEQMLDQCFAFLADTALQQPRVFVHRDYHSRNLMISTPAPGIIDFQDAVYGPASYDLVSLLRDCYIDWPRQQVENWVRDYHRASHGDVAGVDFGRFLAWFDLMGVQRHFKASGIFARLYHRDGKAGYLNDIPRTLAYVQQVAAGYPELKGVAGLLEEQVLPALDALAR